MYGIDATEENVRHSNDCRKSSKFFFRSVMAYILATELWKESFQCDALDILREIKQITA